MQSPVMGFTGVANAKHDGAQQRRFGNPILIGQGTNDGQPIPSNIHATEVEKRVRGREDARMIDVHRCNKVI